LGHARIRWTAVIVAAAIASGLGGRLAPASSAVSAAACTTSWQSVPSSTFTKDLRDLDVLAENNIWAVGSHTEGQVVTAVEHWDGTAWNLVASPNPGAGENALNGVTAVAADDIWAVGYYQVAKKTSDAAFKTMAQHWNGSSWTVVSSPNVGVQSNTLASVDAVATDDVWAVGYHYVAGTVERKTLIEHWNGASWSVVPSPDPGMLSDALLSVNAVAANDVWATGYQSDGDGYAPLMLHWDGSSWSEVPVGTISSQETVLTSVQMNSSTSGWAAGYQLEGSQMQPFVARWNGTAWSPFSSPVTGSAYSMLHDVYGTASDLWVVGLGYDTKKNQFVSLSAHYDGSAWGMVRTALATANAKSELFAIKKAPSGKVWTVGRPADVEALCGNPATSPTFSPNTQSYSVNTDPTLPAAGPADGTLPPGWTLGTATAVAVSDQAAAAGVSEGTLTHGSNVADFNNDGHMDLFVNRHLQRPARLYRNNGDATFTEVQVGTFKKHDRHGCDWGDVQDDGRLDLFCVVGSDRGTEAKHNELWIQQSGGTFVDQAAKFGVIDPFGRGRISHFVDANGDRWPDLLVANFADRADGLPSPNRLYINVRGNYFVPAPSYGLELETGAGSITTGDYDRDGRQDILTDGATGVRLYRNVGGTSYDDVTAAEHLISKPQDVTFADLNGDGRLDVITATTSALKVYLQSGGDFPLSASIPVDAGFALATGDSNGDNAPDVVVVQGAGGGSPNRPDLIFFNDGTGTSFTQMTLPSVSTGQADSASAIDYDENGLMDFFVENGNGKAETGPLQLFAFTAAP